MNSNTLEHINLIEIRVAAILEETKEFEGGIKKHNEEINIMKAKQKQIAEELGYKRKIVTEKEWELAGLKRLCSTWENMMKEKELILLSKTDELDSLQNKVWNTRIVFHSKTKEFLSQHNFLGNIHSRLEVLMQKQKERNSLLASIEVLDQKLNSIEKTHGELKSSWDLIQHLEKEKENLIEFESSPEVLSQELESLEKELSKYSERATMTPHEISLMQSYLNDQTGDSMLEENEEFARVSFSHGKKKSFMPKMPSFLIQKQSINDDGQRRARGISLEK